METFTLPADKLYRISKKTFFFLIPSCDVNFVEGHRQMFFDMRKVAEDQKKTDRRTTTALVLSYCSEAQLIDFAAWLSDYFSEEMQMDIFGLIVNDKGEFVPGKLLNEALSKINSRKR